MEIETQTPQQPLWLRRLGAVLYILFSLELGIMLILLPWKDAWTDNSVFASYPAVREWMNQNFVRGAVSGLGVVNIWLAMREAGRFLGGRGRSN